MTETVTKANLSPQRKHLLEMMQGLNFGLIEALVVRDGEPILDPPPLVVHDVKFCAENGSRSESNIDDFVLKAEVRNLFTHFDALGNGTIRCLEVKHGLPFRMQVEEVHV